MNLPRVLPIIETIFDDDDAPLIAADQSDDDDWQAFVAVSAERVFADPVPLGDIKRWQRAAEHNARTPATLTKQELGQLKSRINEAQRLLPMRTNWRLSLWSAPSVEEIFRHEVERTRAARAHLSNHEQLAQVRVLREKFGL